MIRKYLATATRRAYYEILPDDGTCYREIPGFKGVYANGPQLGECRDLLEEVLEEWLLLAISRGHQVPDVNGLDLEIKNS